MKKRSLWNYARGHWPKTCWQLKVCQRQYREREACPAGISTNRFLNFLKSTTFCWLDKKVTRRTVLSWRIIVIFQASGGWQQHPFLPVVFVSRISSRSQGNTWILHGLQEFRADPWRQGQQVPVLQSTAAPRGQSAGPRPGLLGAQGSCGAARAASSSYKSPSAGGWHNL